MTWVALAGCAALPEAKPVPFREWSLAQRSALGYPAGHACLTEGTLLVFEPRPFLPTHWLEVREERAKAPAGEEIRVRVAINPIAPPGRYRVSAASDATFVGPREMELRPGERGAFRLFSPRPGLAKVEVKLSEVTHELGPFARRPE